MYNAHSFAQGGLVCGQKWPTMVAGNGRVSLTKIGILYFTTHTRAHWLEKEVYFINYTIGVRVKKGPSEQDIIEKASLCLWERVKDLKVYAELDDANGTSLQKIIKYQIPKRRYLNRSKPDPKKPIFF